jgi:glycosyltransferase involved in cell wall biosynthesis
MRRLRVVQVITRFVRGGAQQVVLQLLRKLPREEFEQELLCGADGGAGGRLLEEAGATGARVRLLPGLVREVRPRSDLRALAGLADFFRRRRPDVVHAHTYKAGVLASVAGRLAGVRAVLFTPHGHIFAPGAAIPGVPGGGWKLEALRWVTRAAQSCAHRVTALSEPDLREQLLLGLSPRSKYVVVRNGVDVERFGASGRRLFEGSPVVGAVGRFASEKGHRFFLEALFRVRQKLPGARGVLVGYGELEGELRNYARLLSLGDGVVFAGERDSSEVLPSFDLFVQPSLYESQGLAILEAMAAGRPVVATDVGGVRDAVRHGETGLLVPPADPEALAAAIVRLAEAPEYAASLAARARARVRETFSADRMVAAYARLYNRLLGRYNSGPCTTS